MMTPIPRTARVVALTILAFGAAADDADGSTPGSKHAEWTAPPEARDRPSPIAADEAARTAGKAIYTARCVQCHGAEGKGDGKAAKFLKIPPEDLTEEEVAEATDGELHWKIATGRLPMPAFGGKLKDGEIWQVVAWIRHLGELTGESKLPAATSSPAPEASPSPSPTAPAASPETGK